ncbi:MAG: DUF6798 domain-containing protein [Planctomycetota bacterium]
MREAASHGRSTGIGGALQVAMLFLIMFAYAADPPPAVNEAHYLVKAKNFWDSSYVADDLFASSGKAHTTFYFVFGWLTKFVSLEATAWIGRVFGWLLLAAGLRACCIAIGIRRSWSMAAVLVVWTVAIEYGNLAGEWVIGGIEAKVPAYGFALIGLSHVIRGRWSSSWVWFGVASAFHVLTGGWCVVAAMVAFFVSRRLRLSSEDERGPDSLFSVGLFVGGAISLLGLLPAAMQTLGADPESGALAARIYSYVRIRHHLLPGDFPWHWYARHSLVVVSFLSTFRLATRNDAVVRLQWFAVGAALIAFVGLGVGLLPAVLPDLAAKLLRYYWFRLSDAMLPLAVTLILISRLNRSQQSASDARPSLAPVFAGLLVAFSAIVFGVSVYQRTGQGVPPSARHRLLGIRRGDDSEAQKRAFQDWLAVCAWIKMAMPEDEVLLTPRHQQTFKWYAERAEVVNWKDVPQDAKSLIEWHDRFREVFPESVGRVRLRSTRVPISYELLRGYRDRYGARFLVVDTRVATSNLPLVKIYPAGEQENQTYHVYELPAD